MSITPVTTRMQFNHVMRNGIKIPVFVQNIDQKFALLAGPMMFEKEDWEDSSYRGLIELYGIDTSVDRGIVCSATFWEMLSAHEKVVCLAHEEGHFYHEHGKKMRLDKGVLAVDQYEVEADAYAVSLRGEEALRIIADMTRRMMRLIAQQLHMDYEEMMAEVRVMQPRRAAILAL